MDNLTTLKLRLADVQQGVGDYSSSRSITDYKNLQAQIRKLQVAAATPDETLYNFRLQVTGHMAITMLIELGVIDAIIKRHNGKATATELAETIGCDSFLISRLMRLLSALQFCEEIDEDTYKTNHVTVLLNEPGWVGGLLWMELMFPVAACFRDFMASDSFDRNSANWKKSPFEFAWGKSMWDILTGRPDHKRHFDAWMGDRKKYQEYNWHIFYPPSVELTAADLKMDSDAVLMVDVGGVDTSQLMNFSSQFSSLPGRLIMQCPSDPVNGLTPPKHIEIMVSDLFKPQPLIGAKFYFLRRVIHNWPYRDCCEILANIAAAMDPEYSILLIYDYVLPNKGAELRSVMADIHMLNLFNSSERTLSQYTQMLATAGLKIQAVYPAGMNEESVVEVKIATN